MRALCVLVCGCVYFVCDLLKACVLECVWCVFLFVMFVCPKYQQQEPCCRRDGRSEEGSENIRED